VRGAGFVRPRTDHGSGEAARRRHLEAAGPGRTPAILGTRSRRASAPRDPIISWPAPNSLVWRIRCPTLACRTRSPIPNDYCQKLGNSRANGQQINPVDGRIFRGAPCLLWLARRCAHSGRKAANDRCDRRFMAFGPRGTPKGTRRREIDHTRARATEKTGVRHVLMPQRRRIPSTFAPKRAASASLAPPGCFVFRAKPNQVECYLCVNLCYNSTPFPARAPLGFPRERRLAHRLGALTCRRRPPAPRNCAAARRRSPRPRPHRRASAKAAVCGRRRHRRWCP
jgi:hypothetical protein